VAIYIGVAMMGVAAVSALLSGFFRKVEGHPGFTAFLIKLPAYAFLGIFMLIAAGFSSWLRHKTGAEDEL
jgi:hypothetical protein